MAKPAASYMIWKVENQHNLDLSNWVGPLGLAGMTAWVSWIREAFFFASRRSLRGHIWGSH